MKKTLSLTTILALFVGCLFVGCNGAKQADQAPVATEPTGIQAVKSLRGWYSVSVETSLMQADQAVMKVLKNWRLNQESRSFNGFIYRYKFISGDRTSYQVVIEHDNNCVKISTFVTINHITSDDELSCNLLSDILVALGVEIPPAQ